MLLAARELRASNFWIREEMLWEAFPGEIVESKSKWGSQVEVVDCQSIAPWTFDANETAGALYAI